MGRTEPVRPHRSHEVAPRLRPVLLLPDVLIPKQRPFPRLLVINNGRWIAQLLELARGHIVEWIVDHLALQVLELGDPIPDVIPIRITFLRLGDCVEDPLWSRGELPCLEWNPGYRALTKYG